MSQISIEKYQDPYFNDMIDLIVSSFRSKFCHRQKISEDDIKNILCIIWDITSDDDGYLHYIAKDGQRVVGVLLVRYKAIQKSQKKIPVFNLFHQYGFFNVIFLIFKLSVLDVPRPEDCYIEHIAVHKSMRGRGIGKMLIDQAEKALRDRGFSSLTLAVAQGNPAKHLYDRIGFKETNFINGRFQWYFTGIKQWTIMTKRLKS